MLKVKKSVLPEELLLNETEKKLLEENPVGLHLHFFWIPNGVMAFFTPKPEHQSYNGRMHGGLITVLLDEIMGNYLFKKEGVPAYTARIDLRFRTPVQIGTTIRYTARIDLRFRTPVQIGTTIRCEGHEVKRKGRLVVMEGVIINPDGTVAAEATSTLMLEK